MAHDLNHKLQERIKELTALHQTARILQSENRLVKELFQEIVNLLPGAWQYPEIAAARIQYDGWEVVTANFAPKQPVQVSVFEIRNGGKGSIEVVYLEERPEEDEGPFLKEERDLIESLAEMLRSFLQRQHAEEALLRTNSELEMLVEQRTQQLRKLSQELCLTEARERREIASDLHDHVGQALALIRFQISQFRSNAVFCGFENQTSEILTLLDQTIRYTRDLTCSISPPVLYELGLTAALEWLADNIKSKYGISVSVKTHPERIDLTENLRIIIFKCANELLINVVKHANAGSAWINVSLDRQNLIMEVRDDGAGFDPQNLDQSTQGDKFGLFSIRERIRLLGGGMHIMSKSDQGTTVLISIPGIQGRLS